MKYVIFVGSTLFLAAPALAADAASADEMVVVATGTQTLIDRTGQTISVIDRTELDQIQGPDLTRALERLPGVALARNGPAGASTSLFVRGADSNHVLVLIDGVRVADYASPGGNYDLGALQAGTLGKIELLRGSNSVVWGSQAMGGVLAVTSRELDGAEASIEHGAYATTYATAAAGIQRDSGGITLDAGYLHSDGFSAKTGSDEADGVRQWNLAGRAWTGLSEGLVARVSGRYANTRLGVDLAGSDAPDTQYGKEGSVRAALDYTRGDLVLTGGVGFNAMARRYDSPSWGPSEYLGHAVTADFKGHVALPADFALDFGADSEWSQSRSTYDRRETARLSSAHALLGWQHGPLSLAAGARIDDHDRFGSRWTFGANGSAMLADGWRLRAAYGEGFKAPTLYQLYGSWVGNLALRPETSRSYEAGIEKGDRNSPFRAALTWFRRDSRNLIDLDDSYTYFNIARARAEGVELALGARPSERLAVFASYTWLKARDLGQNRDLARRPRHTVALGADWTTPLAGLALGADLRFVSDAVDYAYGGAVLPIASHVVATLRASLPVSDRFELFGRIENVGDARYQTVSGYNTPGRSGYAGVRAKF